ncbi:peptidylprolyl isomerase, partial [Vibrio sp. FNV 38]|nr:peptidylprolyl isomerase [Vibrio sp. FNV 38]
MTNSINTKIKQLVKQPLVTFSLIALSILVIDETLLFEAQESNVTVNNSNLRTYVNVNYGLDNVDLIQSYIDSLDNDAKESLINEYLENEALYYFALNRSLDKNDEDLKSVISAKSKNVIEMMVNAEQSIPDDKQTKAFFDDNIDRYMPGQTYNVLLVNRDDDVLDLDITLNKSDPTLRKVVSYSNNNTLSKVYRDVNINKLSNVFGESIASEIIAQETNTWKGPYQLNDSFHWVKLDINPSTVTDFSKIKSKVKQDLYEHLVELRYQEVIG